MKKPQRPTLVFTSAPAPKLATELTATQRAQVSKLDWIRVDDALGALQWFTITKDGLHVYDAVLHAGDDGHVFRAGTATTVASFSQGGVSRCPDDELEEMLEDGYDAYLADKRPVTRGRR